MLHIIIIKCKWNKRLYCCCFLRMFNVFEEFSSYSLNPSNTVSREKRERLLYLFFILVRMCTLNVVIHVVI